MSYKTRNKTRGIKSVPHLYDGEDILNKMMSDTIESGFLSPGIYHARAVGSTRMTTDPESEVPYKVMAYIPELDELMGEPSNYFLPSDEERQVLSFYEPSPSSLQPPGPGEHIIIQIIEPKERVGYYVGKMEETFKYENLKGKSLAAISKASENSKATDAFSNKSKKSLESNQNREYSPVEKRQPMKKRGENLEEEETT